MAQLRLALVGATGNLGREVIRLLEEGGFEEAPILVASDMSSGETIPFLDGEHEVKVLKEYDFKNIDVAIFATPKEISAQYVPAAVEAGARVIDASAQYHADEKVPLVVPFLNGEDLAKDAKIISIPDCPSVQLAATIGVLSDLAPIAHITTTALVSTSGAGRMALDELYSQSAALLGGAGAEQVEAYEFPTQIAYNCLPQVGQFNEKGETTAETAILLETNRLLKTPAPITATSVRVPTFIGCSQSVTVEFTKPVEAKAAREALEKAEKILVIDDPKKQEYSTPFGAAETDGVYVSRIRTDMLNPHILSFWVVSDNLRRGSGLNIVELLALMAK